MSSTHVSLCVLPSVSEHAHGYGLHTRTRCTKHTHGAPPDRGRRRPLFTAALRRHRAPGLEPARAGQEAGRLGCTPGLGTSPAGQETSPAGQEAGNLGWVPGLVPGLGRPVGRLSRVPARPVGRPGRSEGRPASFFGIF